jgi:hypothetical protein
MLKTASLSNGLAFLALACAGSTMPPEAPPPMQPAAGVAPARSAQGTEAADPIKAHSAQLFEEGRRIFRYDTFGDEAFWGDVLHLHRAIAGERNGGVGPGVSPKTALAVGLKVDAQALPAALVEQIKNNQVNLDDPATTLALLKLNAVVGVTGFFDTAGGLKSLGIQCAVCHSTVDDSFAPGIGNRLDGWANQDLNVGAIINLSPDLSAVAKLLGVDQPTLRKVITSWGPGKFDALVFMDGKALRPDGKPGATLIPPAFGLAGVNYHTFTGWGSVTYWNAFVANLLMHGSGRFTDPRLNDAKFPVATKAKLAQVSPAGGEDSITPKLAALHYYQLALPAPEPPAGSFDAEAAARGQALFNTTAKCSSCHVPPLFTEPGYNMHTPQEIGIDDFQAKRSPEGRYRTTPLSGLFSHQKRGFYHDGRFATLADVINHYDDHFALKLTGAQKTDLVEYLKSL